MKPSKLATEKEMRQYIDKLESNIQSFRDRVYNWDKQTREFMELARSPEGREMYASTLDTLKNIKQMIDQEFD